MLRRGLVALAVTSAAFAAVGCSSKKSEGLPPAQDWQSPPEGAGSMPSTNPHAAGGGGRIDPHAGVAGAPPLGGSMGGGGAGGDPHAGVAGAPPLGGGGGGGVDVAAMGLPEPDPNR